MTKDHAHELDLPDIEFIDDSVAAAWVDLIQRRGTRGPIRPTQPPIAFDDQVTRIWVRPYAARF